MTRKIDKDGDQFAKDFSKDIPRGLQGAYGHEAAPLQAFWQAPESILKASLLEYDPDDPKDKMLVGAFGPRLIGMSDDRHMLTVAGSRAGKSVTVAANLLLYRGSALVIDPKGELASITARRRRDLGQKVFVLDPFGVTENTAQQMRASFNPLASLTMDNRTLIEDAGLVADALVVSDGERDPHWNESARSFIETVILHVVTEGYGTGAEHNPTLLDVRQCIVDALTPPKGAQPGRAEMIALKRSMQDNVTMLRKSETPHVRAVAAAIEAGARDFYEKEERERSAVLSTVRRHTRFLDYSSMRNVLSGHDFDLEDLKRGRVTIYLCLPASRLSLCGRWFRLFVNLMLVAMERVKGKPAVPVLVCLDEFAALGRMKILEDAVGQIAGFGVRLWVIVQDWGQGSALYGERWESFAANSGIVQFFGNTDVTTTEYISRRLGQTQRERVQLGEVDLARANEGLRGESRSWDQLPLMAPDEIARQFARNDKFMRQIVFWSGYHPFMIQRVVYFDEKAPHHAVFKGHYDVLSDQAIVDDAT